jgi:hypothetical protein
MFPSILDVPLFPRNIRRLEFNCNITRTIDFPPPGAKEDIDTPESNSEDGVPSIPAWARFIETAICIQQLTLCGDVTLKVLIKLALSYVLPNKSEQDNTFLASLLPLIKVEFSDMQSPAAIHMILTIVRNLHAHCKDLECVFIFDCMPMQGTKALEEELQEEMPGRSISIM